MNSYSPDAVVKEVAQTSIRPSTVAIVPAFNRAESIGATLRALREAGNIDAVVVVDDGSHDDTWIQAQADADVVVRFERNLGKGAALERGIEQFPDAEVYLFVDADLADTAGAVASLLGPVLADDADLVIGVPVESAGRRGGLGMVRSVAATGIQKACGFTTTAPLSGQRAIRGSLVRDLKLASRFGVETAMTIDAARRGSRVVEVPIQFDHRHTGRSISGFVHRAWQGVDIVRALAPRVLSAPLRTLGKILCALAILLVSLFVPRPGAVSDAGLVRAQRKIDRVLVFGMPRVQLDDLNADSLPNLFSLLDKSAVGATSVRTLSGRPSSTEGYATVGAGARVRVADGFAASYGATEQIGSVTAAELTTSRTGLEITGAIAVPGIAATQRINEGKYVPSLPGALADAFRWAGKRVGVVANSDTGIVADMPGAARARPASAMATDSSGAIEVGVIGSELLQVDSAAPQGVRVNEQAFVDAVVATLNSAELVIADPGELDRVGAVRADTTDSQFGSLRLTALRRTDRILRMILDKTPTSTLVIVTSVRPSTSEWELTPTVIVNAPVGYLQSPSTQRLGLITLTDIAPTILEQLGIEQPKGMIGNALGVSTTIGRPSLERLRDLNSLAAYRERIYLPLTKGYVIFQTLIYLGTILLFSSRGGVGRSANWLERIVLGVAAWPLATFVFRMIPSAWHLGPFGGIVVLLIDCALVWVARRRSIHRLSSLSRILFATVTVIVVDVCLGARLQQASILGYSPHTAARFTGIGNAAFASLAVCTVLWVGIHVQFAENRKNALMSAAVVCALVFVVDGAPWLGSDVGGILTLAPVFGLLLYVLSGRKLSAKAFLAAASATISVLGIAVLVDLTRPADSRSHLGRFVLDIGKDNSTFSTTIGRKIATNVRVFTGSFWTWIVPVIAVTLLFFLGAQRGWQRDLPVRSALRAGLVASLLAGLLGFAVNDSGTVVTALVFVEIGPMVTLLALRRNDVRTIVGRRT
jgi:hypothetical protein